MTVVATRHAGSYDLTLEVETDRLLPGRLVDARLRIANTDGGQIRGARATLTGTESWRYDTTTNDAVALYERLYMAAVDCLIGKVKVKVY